MKKEMSGEERERGAAREETAGMVGLPARQTRGDKLCKYGCGKVTGEGWLKS